MRGRTGPPRFGVATGGNGKADRRSSPVGGRGPRGRSGRASRSREGGRETAGSIRRPGRDGELGRPSPDVDALRGGGRRAGRGSRPRSASSGGGDATGGGIDPMDLGREPTAVGVERRRRRDGGPVGPGTADGSRPLQCVDAGRLACRAEGRGPGPGRRLNGAANRDRPSPAVDACGATGPSASPVAPSRGEDTAGAGRRPEREGELGRLSPEGAAPEDVYPRPDG